MAVKLKFKVMIRSESTMRLPRHGPLKQRAKDVCVRRLVEVTDACLAIGSWNQEFYLHYGADPKKVFMMPYAVDNDFFRTACTDAADRREELRRSLELEPGPRIILYASKITERKHGLDLLEAYTRLIGKARRALQPYLLFVGDGEMKLTLERKASQLGLDSVRFLGFKNQTELPAYYDLCDVFVLPSFHEPWGLVVNEVMNAGRAVIVSDQVGSGADLVRHLENGYVFRAGDVEDLSNGLQVVLSSEERCRQMGNKSLEIIGKWCFEEDIVGLRQALSL